MVLNYREKSDKIEIKNETYKRKKYGAEEKFFEFLEHKIIIREF